ncbi:MAG: ABC transporter permease [Thermomicrobiales bacterium]|nr:ABC transporter permease [Thermomicrobiales bacterium]MCO5222315.1 ABC transporter permease [Thermomicrobiales bacterium]
MIPEDKALSATTDPFVGDKAEQDSVLIDYEGLGRSRPIESNWHRAWRRFKANRVALIALLVTIAIVLFAILAPVVSYITGYTYYENHLGEKLAAPGQDGYILGSDGNGRDVLTRLAYGGRVSLLVAGLAVISLLLLGGLIGSVAGYFGGWVDTLLMRAADVLLSIPTLVLLILVSSFYRPDPWELAVLIALVSWAGISRLVRGEVISLKHREFVDASRVIGASNSRIILRHLLPNVVPILIVWASLAVPSLILTEATLSYLGLGVQAPQPSWGNMLQEAKQFVRQSWSFVFIPGLMIFITSLCTYLVGLGLRDALDPRLNN